MTESVSESATAILSGLTVKNSIKILHVDDDPDFLKVSKQILAERGSFQVDTASSVDEAAEKMKKETYDAIVSDYQMSDTDGLQFLKELREEGNSIPFVIFTGKGREEVAIKALNLGAHGYFNKSGPPETVYGELAHGMRQIVDKRRAEQSFLKSEDKYRRLVETLREGIWVIDKDSYTTFVNPRMAEMLGYDMDEMKGRHLFSFMDERGVEIAKRFLERRRQGIKEQHDFEFLRKDRTRVYTTLETTPITDDNRNYIGALASVVDVTERKKAEQALKESEEKYRSLVELAPDGIVAVNTEGMITSANRSFLTLLGYDSEEIVGKPFIELKTSRGEDIPKMQELFKSVMKGESPSPVEFVYVRKDGTSRWAEVHPSLLLKDGSPLGAQVIMRDVTERKRVEKRLQENEERFRAIIESAPFGYYRVGKDGLWQYVNPVWERMHGLSLEEVVGKPFEITQTEDAVEQAKEYVKRALAGETLVGEFSRLTGEGDIGYHSFNIQPVKRNNEIVAIEGFINDITERKKAEEALRNSEERWRSLAEDSPDHIMLLDLKGNILYINRTVPDLKREEVIGTSLFNYVPPEWHRVVKDCFKRVLETGKTDHYDTEYRTKDGEVRYFDVRIGPVFQEDRLVAFVSSSTDVTSQKKAGEKFRESEQRFRCLVEEAASYVGIIDLKGQFTYVNKALADSLGYSVQELTGRSFKDFLHPDDRGKIMRLFLKSVVLRRKPQSLEFRVIRKDGHVLHWIAKPTAFVIEGKTVGFQAIITDITERENTEVELRNTKNYLDNLLNHANAPIIVWDNAKRITLFNNAFEALTGHKKKSMLGRNVDILFPPLQKEEILQTIDDATKGEKWKSVEIPILCKDKETKIALWNSANITDGEGKIVATIAQGQDITIRRKTEEALRRSEEQARRLLEIQNRIIDTAITWIDLLDAEGNVTLWNRAAELISGYTREEVMGHKRIWEWLYPDPQYCAKAFARAKKIIDEKLGLNFETEIRCKNGASKTISWYTNSITNEKGKPVGSIAVGLDVSQLKKAERELLEAMEKLRVMNEKLRVVGGLTRHDVRNKLAAVTGNAYLARKKLPENSEVLDYLRQIEASVEQTVRIFDFAKVYEMLGVEQLTYVDLEKAVNEAISLFPDLKGIKIVNDCHGLTVLADSLLTQLFYNLVDNSLKYGKKLSRVRVYYEKKQDHVNVIYEDDGVGIPAAEKRKLFSEGYSTGGSTGYGLYLIKKMTEVYGWTIRETGEHGKGAKFVIKVPETTTSGKENYRIA
jgi:PAS domain S-box-containing protein